MDGGASAPGIGDDPAVNRYDRLIARAREGELIRIDGATGSEVIRRGVPEHELGWSGAAAGSTILFEDCPDDHEDYDEADEATSVDA